MPQYFEKSIESIVSQSSEPLHITVVDSKSERSDQILEIAQRFLAEGKIQRFLACSENVRGFGMFRALRDFPPDPSEDFYVTTDLDLVVPAEVGYWNLLTRKAMEHHVLSGFSLDTANYLPPNSDHTGDGFGNWLCGIKKGFLEREFPARQNIQDYELGLRAMQNGNAKYQIPARLIHLSWDLWKHDPEYFSDKKNTVWLKDPSPDWSYQVYE